MLTLVPERSSIDWASSHSKMWKVSLYNRILAIDLDKEHEVWRTSTPEPTIGAGIIWTYLKDVTRFLPLFAKPGSFILQLDNLIETGLDGEYASK